MVPELNTSIFLIPGEHVKNGEERLVVLNRVAQSVIEALRGVEFGAPGEIVRSCAANPPLRFGPPTPWFEVA